MDPLTLGGLVAVATVVVLFSGVSVAVGLLVVSAGFLIVLTERGASSSFPRSCSAS